MFKKIRKIIKYPRLTQDYPKHSSIAVPFIGKPEIDQKKCTRCGACVNRCPAAAIVLNRDQNDIGINYDECVFCGLCAEICPAEAAIMTSQFELAEKDRNKLRKNPIII
ncbi:MAG: 4Fe-4S binding protein, partial [Acetobacterium sp.]|nr:4Fe-4S binding protein [Acetobacterium sp.]